MKVVVNAGPLMTLGKLGLVHLLHSLYGSVLIPTAVHKEVVTQGLKLGRPNAYATQLAIVRRELAVIEVDDADLSQEVQELPIGAGEKQVIQLGLTESADWVLLDDLLAREEAQELGLNVKGTLGILVDAYRAELLTLDECELVFQAILIREDIWIGKGLVQRVLSGFAEAARRKRSNKS